MIMRQVNGVFLAAGVVVTGDVTLGAGTNLWFGTVVRGDVARVTLAEGVNVQDGCVIHTDHGCPQLIEPGVVVGHAAVLHGSRVGADTLVGIGARLLAGSDVGPECVVAAGAVVTEGTRLPPRSLAVGVPARVVRQVTDEEVARTRAINGRYRDLASRYAEGRIAMPYGPA